MFFICLVGFSLEFGDSRQRQAADNKNKQEARARGEGEGPGVLEGDNICRDQDRGGLEQNGQLVGYALLDRIGECGDCVDNRPNGDLVELADGLSEQRSHILQSQRSGDPKADHTEAVLGWTE